MSIPPILRSGLVACVETTVNPEQLEILISAMFLTFENALRHAALKIQHEGRDVLVEEDFRKGLKYEILMGKGPMLEETSKLVLLQQYDDLTVEQHEFLRQALDGHLKRTQAALWEGYSDDEEEEDDDDESFLCSEEETAEDLAKAVECRCQFCVNINETVPALWEKWAPLQTEGYGKIAVNMVDKLPFEVDDASDQSDEDQTLSI